MLADGHLLPTGGALLSKRELGNGSELFSQLTVDPLDSRQICLCGSNGAVAVLQLTDPAADKIQAQQYRVNLQQQPAGERGGGLWLCCRWTDVMRLGEGALVVLTVV